jgi:hypothetical protein
MTKRKSILGKRMGKLTVMEEAPEGVTYRSNPIIKCKCDCGNDHPVKLINIQRGEIGSCGCIRREQMKRFSGKNSNKFIDKTGTTKGDWTVLGIVEGKPTGKGVYWKYQCKCGVTLETRQSPTSTKCKKCSLEEKEIENKKIKQIDRAGYIRVKSSGHPRANTHGYVLEHILIVEKRIGRFVGKTETIHHINGIRSDNRDENLELWDKNHPPGQRNSEKMPFYMAELEAKCDPAALKQFCENILKKYNEQ